ncbi:EAL domain-containing protein [Xylophilus sp. Kf1]|nr:EAL domain-containing protein [Xylophilus sp. Kf1]
MIIEHDDTPWARIETSLDGTIICANPCFARWTGRSLETLQHQVRWKSLLAPASVILYETHFIPRLHAQRLVNEIALDLKRTDGARFPVLASAMQVEPNGELPAVVVITLFDATETRRFEKELKEARRSAELSAKALLASNQELHAQNEKLRVTLDSIADAVVTANAKGMITSFNATAENITGLAAASVIGQRIDSLGLILDARTRLPVRRSRMFQQDPQESSTTFLYERLDGEVRYVRGSLSRIRDLAGSIIGTVYVCHDATITHLAHRQIEYDASHDHLTGLLNRREFERICASVGPSEGGRAVDDVLLYIDLDQFKAINDSSGHAAGDDALLKTASAMAEVLLPGDSLARLGGDEFGVVLHRATIEYGMEMAEKLRIRLEKLRFVFGTKVYGITASIGVAVLRKGIDSARSAMMEADMACIVAKEAGRNRVHLFSVSKGDLWQRQEELAWASRIRQGLDDDRLVLYFQPIVRLGNTTAGRRKGELLLRFRDDDGNLVSPAPIISAAERFNLMGQVDRWVIRRAFAWLSETRHVEVSINISGQSLGDMGFRQFVVQTLKKYTFDTSRICFEITETAAIVNIESALDFVRELRQFGVKMALDDFGAGLSSFAYLRTLSPDYIKIDGNFVKTMLADPVSCEIVHSIFRIAHACRLETVAEWVEDEATLVALTDMGIDYAQGFYTGRPDTLDSAVNGSFDCDCDCG